MTQVPLFPEAGAAALPPPAIGGWIEGLPPACTYLPSWLGSRECEELVRKCRDLGPCRARLRMYGRDVERPRATAWLAENGRGYVYGGAVEPCRGWPVWAADLAGRIAMESAWAGGPAGNGVLLNFYESGGRPRRLARRRRARGRPGCADRLSVPRCREAVPRPAGRRPRGALPAGA